MVTVTVAPVPLPVKGIVGTVPDTLYPTPPDTSSLALIELP